MAVSLGGFKGPNFPCPETADRRAEPQRNLDRAIVALQ